MNLEVVEEEAVEEKVIYVPKVQDMDTYLIRHYKDYLMTNLNTMLDNGRISEVLGHEVASEQILPGECNFRRFDYWRLNQTDLLIDIDLRIELQVKTEAEVDTDFPWFSLTLWFSFAADEEICEIEDFCLLEDRPERKDDWKLDKYLVPVIRRDEIESGAENLLLHLFQDDSPFALPHSAMEVARKFGLSIRSLPLYKSQNTASMIFFCEGTVLVRADRPAGAKKEPPPKEETVPANTIVLNTELSRKDCIDILHECIHYEWHYLFYRLQNMHNNDMKQMRFVKKKIMPKKEKDFTNPIEFMEYQAKYGSYALMLPYTFAQKKITELYEKASENNCKDGYSNHDGRKFDYIIRSIATSHLLPKALVRARCLQLGYDPPRGALNYADGRYITPFAVSDWENTKGGSSYVIDRKHVAELYKSDESFQKIMQTGQFVYVDGHVVCCETAGITYSPFGCKLSAWANGHIDMVSLRFQRKYLQDQKYSYTFGKMNCKEAVESTFRFLDLGSKFSLKEAERIKNELMEDMPLSFHSALAYIMKGRVTVEELTKRIPISKSTLLRLRTVERKRYDLDQVIAICIGLHLPPWLSEILLDKAGLTVKRYGDFGYYGTILDCFYGDTIQEVQAFLADNNYAQLTLKFEEENVD